MSELTIPGGKEKGRRLPEASQKTLAWWMENAKQDTLKEACRAELKRRAEGGVQEPPSTTSATQAPATTQAAAPVQLPSVIGSFGDAHAATERLTEASQKAHLVAPATVCATLPEGCEVALAVVVVDAARETYPVGGGKLGLDKTALNRIEAAAGVSWDMHFTGRLDDGSDPEYVHFRAAGTVRNFDGSSRTISGEVEIDARDGSPQIDEIITKARQNNRDPRSQIMELRKFILRHAETKAKLRAVRELGVRTSYTADELRKPFVVAKLMFTGASADPEARREFRGRIADSFLGAKDALYGGETAARTPAPALPDHSTHRPPPVGAVRSDSTLTIETTATPQKDATKDAAAADAEQTGPEDDDDQGARTGDQPELKY